MKRIALHKMNIFKANAIISTVQIAENEFETMVMFDDGEEILYLIIAQYTNIFKNIQEIF